MAVAPHRSHKEREGCRGSVSMHFPGHHSAQTAHRKRGEQRLVRSSFSFDLFFLSINCSLSI